MVHSYAASKICPTARSAVRRSRMGTWGRLSWAPLDRHCRSLELVLWLALWLARMKPPQRTLNHPLRKRSAPPNLGGGPPEKAPLG